MLILSMSTVFLSACTPADDPAEPPRASSEKDLTLPFDAYDLNPTQRSIVDRADFKVADDCLRKFGLRMPASKNTTPVEYPKNADYAGWLKPRNIEVHGYQGPPGMRDEAFAALDGRRAFVIPANIDAAYTGLAQKSVNGVEVPAGGCADEAERALNAGAPNPAGTGPAMPRDHKELLNLMDARRADRAERPSAGRCRQTLEHLHARTGLCLCDPVFRGDRPEMAEDIGPQNRPTNGHTTGDRNSNGRRTVPD
ncbi:hypothetical protein [Herbidospora cretacea]|uniref:hypothetical protein n=1 Tax=Herbidospora cretacea TaxID=28444 RepID=UPI0012DE465C|nr:hypothetical protein [Herbidospora cretacea]